MRPSITMLMIAFEDEPCEDTSIKRKALMECLITMEPKQVTSNSSENLKTMMLRTGNMKFRAKR